MTSIPELHPLLNFETIRCELDRCCRDTESWLAECHQQCRECREAAAGSEQEFLDEQFQDLENSMKWLRQRVQTFQPAEAASRNDWAWLSDEVGKQLHAVQTRAESLVEEMAVLSDDGLSGGPDETAAESSEPGNSVLESAGSELCGC